MIKITFARKNIAILRKILGIMLMLAILGVSPGINEIFQVRSSKAVAAEKQEVKSNPFENSPFAVKVSSDSDKAAVKEAVTTVDGEDKVDESTETKKKMSTFEDIAWLVARSLLPTVAVMAFSAAVVCPLACGLLRDQFLWVLQLRLW